MYKIVSLLCVICVVHGWRAARHKPSVEDGCYRNGHSAVCWEADDYPAEEIQKKLMEYEQGYINGDIGDYYKHHMFNVSQPAPPCALCKTTLSFRQQPLKLREKDDECYVVHAKNYQQELDFTMCSPDNSEDSLCASMAKEQFLNYQGQCQQKDTIIRMLCYDPKKMDFVVWNVHYPSSCVCMISKITV